MGGDDFAQTLFRDWDVLRVTVVGGNHQRLAVSNEVGRERSPAANLGGLSFVKGSDHAVDVGLARDRRARELGCVPKRRSALPASQSSTMRDCAVVVGEVLAHERFELRVWKDRNVVRLRPFPRRAATRFRHEPDSRRALARRATIRGSAELRVPIH
jgi:hypothetical protein